MGELEPAQVSYHPQVSNFDDGCVLQETQVPSIIKLNTHQVQELGGLEEDEAGADSMQAQLLSRADQTSPWINDTSLNFRA